MSLLIKNSSCHVEASTKAHCSQTLQELMRPLYVMASSCRPRGGFTAVTPLRHWEMIWHICIKLRSFEQPNISLKKLQNWKNNSALNTDLTRTPSHCAGAALAKATRPVPSGGSFRKRQCKRCKGPPDNFKGGEMILVQKRVMSGKNWAINPCLFWGKHACCCPELKCQETLKHWCTEQHSHSKASASCHLVTETKCWKKGHMTCPGGWKPAAEALTAAP